MTENQQIRLDHLEIKINVESDEAIYTFAGDIDEHFAFQKIPLFNKACVRLRLGEIRSVNSCGVREWIFFMRGLEQVPSVVAEECSIAMVDQFNTVPQTLGKAHVRSFYAPYFCPKCDEEVSQLVETEVNQEALKGKHAPVLQHTCGSTMEFDALEECYFHQIERFFKK